MPRRKPYTACAYLPSGSDVPEPALAWLDAFGALAARFPTATGLRVTFDGQGNVHAYIGDEEVEGLYISKAGTRLSGED